ncbi:MAG: HEAT repeat domain-containing protein [Pseudomonadota bacterium]
MQKDDGFSYEFEIDTRATFSLSSFMGKKANKENLQKTHNLMKGKISFRALKDTDDRTLMAGQLSELEYEINKRKAFESIKELSIPFKFKLGSNCSISEIDLSYIPNKKNKQLIENVIYELQMTFLGDENQEKWQAKEENALAGYEANYLVNEISKDSISIHKAKEKYFTSNTSSNKSNESINVISSDINISISKNKKWFDSISTKESIEILKNDEIFMQVENKLKIKKYLKPIENLALWQDDIFSEYENPIDIENFSKIYRKSQLSHESNERDINTLINRSLNRSFSQILEDYKKNILSKNPLEKSKALDLLVSYLRAKEGASLELTHAIKTGDLENEYQSMAFLALELSSTNESQKALMDVLQDVDHSSMNRMRSVIALQDIKNPAPEVFDSMIIQMNKSVPENVDRGENDVARTSALSLGTLAANNKEAFGARAKEELLKNLKSANNSSETALYIRALGNTKNPLLIDDIVPYLNSSSSSVRSASADTIGAIDSVQSEAILLNQFSEEESKKVRLSIMKSLNKLSKTSENSTNSISNLILFEENKDVRAQMIIFLGQRAAYKALLNFKNHEKDSDNIALIGRYIK